MVVRGPRRGTQAEGHDCGRDGDDDDDGGDGDGVLVAGVFQRDGVQLDDNEVGDGGYRWYDVELGRAMKAKLRSL